VLIWITTVEAIDHALKFIDHIEKASLSDEIFPKELREAVGNPMRTLFNIHQDPSLRLSLRLFFLAINGAEAQYNIARDAILEYNPDCNILSYHLCKQEVRRLTGIVPIIADMCPDSCMAYTGPFQDRDTCIECGKARYLDKTRTVRGTAKTEKVAAQQFYTIPIAPFLQALHSSPDNARLLRYRQEKTQEIMTRFKNPTTGEINITEIDDFFCGTEYLKAVIEGDIEDNDIVLVTSIDGAQLYEMKHSDCWIYIWIIMDLPPNYRYKKQYLIPGGVIPGPNKPKNIDSFMFPGLAHVRAAQTEGLMVWDAATGSHVKRQPIPVCGTADGPGLTNFSGLVGHIGYLSCQCYCGIKGRRESLHAKRYHPAIFKPNDMDPRLESSNHSDVDVPKLI
ncbi:hypothetical protein FA15DRAFT_546535, partial [Coprinopsis marcescibilis]